MCGGCGGENIPEIWGQLMKVYQLIRNVYINTLRQNRLIHRGLYAVAQTIFFPTWEGVLAFHTHPDDPLSMRFSMLSGEYEGETVKVIKHLIKPGMIALDIGAHVGYYTRILAKLVGISGKVIAFEPHPETFRLLIKNTVHFRNVHLLEVAAADEEAVLTLYDGQLETGLSGLRYLDEYRQWTKQVGAEFTPRVRQGCPLRSFAVKARPVDLCLSELGVTSVHFIKMDIEGAEMKALKGMKRVIGTSPNLVMVVEFNPRLIRAFGVSPREFIGTLRSLGFHSIEAIGKTLQLINEESDEFLQLAESLISGFSSVNLLCKRGN